MKKEALDGIEVEQKLLESLDVGERFGFARGENKSMATYEKRESSIADLYKKYKHILVTSQDELFGANDGQFEFIQNVRGLYKDVQNPGKI